MAYDLHYIFSVYYCFGFSGYLFVCFSNIGEQKKMTTPIDRLRELHEKAKPAPWYWRGKLPDAYVYTEDDDFCILGWEDIQDAKLISELRNTLPALLELYEAALVIEKDHFPEVFSMVYTDKIGRYKKALSALRGEHTKECALNNHGMVCNCGVESDET